MSTTVARLEAVLSADTSDFDKAMGKSESRMGSLAKTAGKAGLAGAIVGLGYAAKVGFSEFMEGQRVAAQTDAVLKSTAGAAKVTAEEVDGLATSLMRKSGVDDEQIKTGENMLLTFTKIRNEVGAGNNIFDQATTATLNLSVAMGKDMQSSAILVGKALNDPIKGMSALSKAGIQFTEDQKETIKTMVASGDTMGAQKIILKELETQFGGSAEAAGKTFGGQIDIAKERLTNFAGEMVGKAIPHLQTMFTTIGDNLPKIRDFAAAFVDKVKPAIKGVYDFLNENLVPILKDLWAVAKTTWEGIAKVLKDNDKEIDRILTAVKSLLNAIGLTLLWIYDKVWVPVLSVMFTKLLPVALEFTIKALDTLVVTVGGVKDGFVWLRDKGGAAIGGIWKAVEKPLGLLKDAFDLWLLPLEKAVDAIKWLIDNIGRIPKPSLPSIDLPDLNPFGDPSDPSRGGINLHGALPVMQPFAAAAAGYGLSVSAGKDDHSMYTSSGRISDHYLGKALDVVGSAAGMAGFFRSLIGNRSVKQAFYDPLGSVFGGLWNSYREGGHSDHVHVATYDQGGWLKPGLTLAYNGLGYPERVGGRGGDVHNHYHVAGSMIYERDLDDRIRQGLLRQQNLGRGISL